MKTLITSLLVAVTLAGAASAGTYTLETNVRGSNNFEAKTYTADGVQVAEEYDSLSQCFAAGKDIISHKHYGLRTYHRDNQVSNGKTVYVKDYKYLDGNTFGWKYAGRAACTKIAQ